MLAFVTSLPHPANCASYTRRSELLRATLGSILAQTDPDIMVVVVANEAPEGDLPDDPRIRMVPVSYAPPHRPEGKPVITDAMYADKGAKLGVGTAIATQSGAEYVMFVDSDDYVSRQLAGFTAAASGEPGWYSDSGYFHVRGSRTVTPVLRDFHQRNGSTHILRTDLVAVPADLDITAPRDEVIERIGRKLVRSLMGDHKWIVSYFEQMGEPLLPLPFAAAIWEIGTGENFSQVLAAAGSKVPVAGSISEEYGLPVPARWQALRSELGGLRARVATRLDRRRESVDELRERIQRDGG